MFAIGRGHGAAEVRSTVDVGPRVAREGLEGLCADVPPQMSREVRVHVPRGHLGDQERDLGRVFVIRQFFGDVEDVPNVEDVGLAAVPEMQKLLEDKIGDVARVEDGDEAAVSRVFVGVVVFRVMSHLRFRKNHHGVFISGHVEPPTGRSPVFVARIPALRRIVRFAVRLRLSVGIVDVGHTRVLQRASVAVQFGHVRLAPDGERPYGARESRVRLDDDFFAVEGRFERRGLRRRDGLERRRQDEIVLDFRALSVFFFFLFFFFLFFAGADDKERDRDADRDDGHDGHDHDNHDRKGHVNKIILR